MIPVAAEPLRYREAAWNELERSTFDVVVIGGGINGAAVARDAVLRGMTVALIERDDFASGTSSKSTKLVHGGVRYLEQGHVGLVLESCRERDLLRTRIAPHLVRGQRFAFPVYEDDGLGVWQLRAGLLAYDLLAAFRNVEMHKPVSAAQLAAREPALLTKGLKGGCLYYDCWTDDARLTIETAMAARTYGATVLNYLELVAFEKDGAGRLVAAEVCDRLSGRRCEVRARSFVNVTGPWLDRVRKLDDAGSSPRLRVTKGVHAVFPRERIGNRDAIVIRGVDDRVMFAIPWQEQTLVGTTDTYYDGDPSEVAADREDVDYILRAVNRAFPRANATDRDVISTFAGLRPLVAPEEDQSESDVSRDDQIWESAAGLISLGGGKLTTHRHVAERIVDRVAARIGRRVGRCRTAIVPLPGAAGVQPGAAMEEPPESREEHIRARYGARGSEVTATVRRDERLGGKLVDDLPDLLAEVLHAIDHEMAFDIDDILERRLQVALRSRERAGDVVAAVAALLASRLGWDEAETAAHLQRYRKALAEEDETIAAKASGPDLPQG
jgi:glycerol-3-phosphate dehydrogenase